ncbi:NADH-quinone oxidoreductase subunit A [Kyrpidia tusciae]|uniref:NADH-quinone oxidoreductase subunit A n=1 Tax=Kyrpidia tusciae (strain DSM 2912 / NBRC 15312 / T2) TaxID=562970 RepID=D5WX58_KYRT2|nr:NADH-quinone oxidoreductase subunit A [Kyrpidia tusciae]ADG07839.1 NADH-ubiquinone/plastoquinone oxidoreductase chain 3 [Kyrpidia tusciae DSM 2912]MBE3552414.1 NADH-quinone oxidoreductase subunit A [Kyrpidia tusciae]
MTAYWNSYLFVVIFVVLAIALAVVALTLGKWLRPAHPSREKLEPYESGVEPVGDARVQYNARYYLFALLFVVFDVEILFLYPWAVAFHELGLFGLVEALIFMAMLVIGLVYAWRKKVLEWK